MVSLIIIGVTDIEQRRKEALSPAKNHIEILNSGRLGTTDYNFDDVKIIKEGGQAVVFEIKSKGEGKTYAAKRLQY